MSNIIQSLWIGSRLKPMHIHAVRSFLKHSHEYHLYCYEPIENVPEGVILKDAREILPESDIFYCQTEPGLGSPSPFSDYFRWKLLLLKGGWWVDTDVVCLRPWDDFNGMVFAREESYVKQPTGEYVQGEQIASCVIRLPKGHLVADRAYEFCRNLDRSQVTWTQPALEILNQLVTQFGLWFWAVPRYMFCPIAWWDWEKLADPTFDMPTAAGVHLYHEMWRRNDKNEIAVFPSESFLGRLCEDTLSCGG